MKKTQITADQIVPICGLGSIEQETSINWIRNDKNMVISTTDNTTVTRLKKLVSTNPDEWKCYAYYNTAGEVDSYQFEAPISLMTLRSATPIREFTPEQKAELSERMKKYQLTKKSSND